MCSLGAHLLHTFNTRAETDRRFGGILYGPDHLDFMDSTQEELAAQLGYEIIHSDMFGEKSYTLKSGDLVQIIVLGGPEGMSFLHTRWREGLTSSELEIYTQLREDGMDVPEATTASQALAAGK